MHSYFAGGYVSDADRQFFRRFSPDPPSFRYWPEADLTHDQH